MSINRVTISGNIGGDPEIRRTQSGMAILSFRMAVNDRRKNPQSGEWEDYCNWIGVAVFGKRAESLSNLLHKGSKIAVDGKLRYSEWQSDGQKRSKVEIIADDVELLGDKGGSGARKSGEPQQVQEEILDTTGGVYDSDCPFGG